MDKKVNQTVAVKVWDTTIGVPAMGGANSRPPLAPVFPIFPNAKGSEGADNLRYISEVHNQPQGLGGWAGICTYMYK